MKNLILEGNMDTFVLFDRQQKLVPSAHPMGIININRRVLIDCLNIRTNSIAEIDPTVSDGADTYFLITCLKVFRTCIETPPPPTSPLWDYF